MEYSIVFEDKTVGSLICNVDCDRHTSVFVRHQLQQICDQTFGEHKRIRSFSVARAVR